MNFVLFVLTTLLSLLILGILTKAFSKDSLLTPPDRSGDREVKPAGIVKLIAVILGSFIIGTVQPISAEMINVGNVGLKVNKMGNEKGVSKTEYVTGIVFYNSWWSSIKEYPVTQQHIDYDENVIITKGGFQASIKPSLNWSVNAGNVADMYQNLKKDVDDIRDTWLKNAILGSVNDVANLYTVDSIFNHRAEFEAEIVKECNKRVSKWFTISQLRTNIVPPAAITAAINAKTSSVQEAQAAIQRTIVATAEAQEKIAKAKGDSAQAVIAAAGQAQAVRLQQMQLTPLYIEYLKVTKWKGDVPNTVLGGSGGTPLLNIK